MSAWCPRSRRAAGGLWLYALASASAAQAPVELEPVGLAPAGLAPASLAPAALDPAAPAQAAPTPAASWSAAAELVPEFALAATRLTDLDHDGASELIAVGTEGRVQVYSWREGALAPLGTAPVLAHPARALLAVGDVLGTGTDQLVVLSPAGAELYSFDAAQGLATTAHVLASRARFELRTGVPSFAEILEDVNADGRLDLVVPRREMFELWLNREAAEPGPPRLEKIAEVELRISRTMTLEAEYLSDQLVSSFQVPAMRTSDVNGDGRPDLLVSRFRTRAFHLQRADGSYATTPDVSVNLDVFRDTSSESELRPGGVVGGSDRPDYQSTDLDGDGLTDYVISHRRKVWVFHGTKAGPQFTEPTVVLKVADDVTALTLLNLDGDPHPDLVLLKVEVPGIASLVMGLLDELDVTVRVVGYANRGGRAFELVPAWKREITVRFPPILDLARHPERLLERLTQIQRRIQHPTEGDFDGDGRADFALVDESGSELRLWRARASQTAIERDAGSDAVDEALIRRILFEDPDTVWTLDRLFELFSSVTAARVSTLTSDRPPDALRALRPKATHKLGGLEASDLDGDGRAELIAYYELTDRPRHLCIDVLRAP